ncbi:MAG: dihydroneopterin aldolase [Duncaniella sp.]|nr:dihydroneopterin aldolase [Duncaniella sp.]
MIGTIEINGLILFARHGVFAQERELGNKFEVTVHLQYPIDCAMQSDDLNETINYAEVVDLIQDVMEHPSKLLENVVFRLHSAIINRYPSVSGGSIKVAKLNPPIPAAMQDVAVKINF